MGAGDDRLISLPKVELHVHLGGTIDEATARDLARRHGVDPAALPFGDGRYPERYGDFQGFLRAYMAVNELVRTPDDLEEVAAAFARRQGALGIRYTEATLTAATYVDNGIAPADMWKALRSGLSEAGPENEVRLIIDVIRDFGADAAGRVIRLVEEADAPIAGLGLTGVEGVVATAEFVLLREAADRLGFGLTVHAGELGPPESVREALDELGADRIAHGVASVRDDDLVARLVREGVALEVCPSSNVSIGLFPSLEEHPFAALWAAGVNVTVSTDDPAMFATTLPEELAHVARLSGLDASGLAELQRRAARAAFAPADVREGLVAGIDAWERGAA